MTVIVTALLTVLSTLLALTQLILASTLSEIVLLLSPFAGEKIKAQLLKTRQKLAQSHTAEFEPSQSILFILPQENGGAPALPSVDPSQSSGRFLACFAQLCSIVKIGGGLWESQ